LRGHSAACAAKIQAIETTKAAADASMNFRA
jgi:hypothetical protein